MPRYRLLALIILLLVLPSCDEGDDKLPVLASCSIEDQNQFVHEVLRDKYLWYQEVEPVINYADFDSPSQLLDFLKYQEKDRFSYITNASGFNNLFSAGQYLGYGFSYLTNSDDTVWVRFVYNDSPAGRAELERGDEILSINGENVVDIINANDWPGIFGPAEEGYPLELVIRRLNKPAQDSSTTTLNLSKTVVNINTVLHQSIINNGMDQIGYLVFKSFLSTSNEEFLTTFSDFKAASVNKLILDLRYNGGGSVLVARNLASYLYANAQTDQVFTRLVHNAKNQSNNSTYRFLSLLDALDLEQLIVITSGETCSASELIINGLKPYMDVQMVGTTTCGKPVGMNNYEFCENALLPVTFASFNTDYEGDYFDGLGTDCVAEDDINYRFGESDEPMFAEALYLAENNQCQLLRPALKPASSLPKEFSAGSVQAIIGAI